MFVSLNIYPVLAVNFYVKAWSRLWYPLFQA